MSNTPALCDHVGVNHVRCQAPALRHYTYCRHHLRYHYIPPHLVPEEKLPVFADSETYLANLARTANEMVNGKLDTKTFNYMVLLNHRAAKLSPWWSKPPEKERRGF